MLLGCFLLGGGLDGEGVALADDFLGFAIHEHEHLRDAAFIAAAIGDLAVALAEHAEEMLIFFRLRQFGGAGKHEAGVPVEEGGDMAFVPDVRVKDGDIIEGRGWSVECVYTPGHTSNHMCFQYREEKALFTGDHVMGWSTSVISPPDGDMAAYMASLERLLAREDRVYWPTHGTSIDEPKTLVRAFIAHRREREEQVLACVSRGVGRIRDMVPLMYVGTPEFMYPAAARSVLAAVEYLVQKGELQCEGKVGLDADYRLKG